MARDIHIAKRNAFVLSGGLLAIYCLIGMIYGQWFRVPDEQCGQGQILLGGCQSVAIVLLPPLVIGLALLVLGFVRYRADPETLEGHLHFGTGTHFTIAFISSLVLFSAAGYIYVGLQEANLSAGEYIAVEISGTEYLMTFILKLALLVSFLLLVAVLGMYLIEGHMRRQFLAAAEALGDDGEDYEEEEASGEPEPAEGWANVADSAEAAVAAEYDEEAWEGHDVDEFDHNEAQLPEPEIADDGLGRTAAEMAKFEEEAGTRQVDPDQWEEAFGEKKAEPRRASMPFMPLSTEPVPAMWGAPYDDDEEPDDQESADENE